MKIGNRERRKTARDAAEFATDGFNRQMKQYAHGGSDEQSDDGCGNTPGKTRKDENNRQGSKLQADCRRIQAREMPASRSWTNMLPECVLIARIDLGRFGLLMDMEYVLILRALEILSFSATVSRSSRTANPMRLRCYCNCFKILQPNGFPALQP